MFLREKLNWRNLMENNVNDSEVINLGCRLNFYESEVIKKVLKEKKIKKKIVINTCAVTNQAVQKSIYEVKKAKKHFPDYEIIVTGCASQVEKFRFGNLEEVDRIIDNNIKTKWRTYLDPKFELSIPKFDFPEPSYDFSKRTRAFLQIQQGCSHRCTFCIIPFGRGDAVSLPLGEISKRVNKLIKFGYREITLTGVDLTSYGDDLPGKPKLGSALKRLFDLHPDLQRLRLSSIDPAEIDEDLMDLFKYEKRLMPYLHFSLQSGDNLILKRMKRRHSREEVYDICEEIVSIRSEIKFGADVIVGFPTETEDNFQNTIDLIKMCKFSNLHIFPFSAKKGTPASNMPQVEKEIKIKRLNFIRTISEKIKSKLMKNKIGETVNLLYESDKKSYTDDYFKVSIINNKSKNFKVGDIVRVKIKSNNENFLLAEIN